MSTPPKLPRTIDRLLRPRVGETLAERAHRLAADLPKLAVALLAAMTSGRVDSVVALFEVGGKLVDAAGTTHERPSGALALALRELISGGFGFEKSGTADDGRVCAIEGNITKLAGADVASHPALLVLERGDSGLVSELRVYRDEG